MTESTYTYTQLLELAARDCDLLRYGGADGFSAGFTMRNAKTKERRQFERRDTGLVDGWGAIYEYVEVAK